jgi:hypothetical protein
MAILIVYELVREGPTEVEYRFGHAADKLDRRVILEKEGDGIEVPDLPDEETELDPTTSRAVTRILRRRRIEGVWPRRGGIQS